MKLSGALLGHIAFPWRTSIESGWFTSRRRLRWMWHPYYKLIFDQCWGLLRFSLLLFFRVMNAITCGIQSIPRKMSYVNDMILTAPVRLNLESDAQKWKVQLWECGLRLNVKKNRINGNSYLNRRFRACSWNIAWIYILQILVEPCLQWLRISAGCLRASQHGVAEMAEVFWSQCVIRTPQGWSHESTAR